MIIRPRRKVTKVFIHCTASNNSKLHGTELLKEVGRWHLARGFKEIGYHYLIDMAGRIMEGRDLEKIPAAQKGHNTGSIAICVHGLSHFTQDSMDALVALCRAINKAYPEGLTFHGHCEVEPNKTCPVFDYKKLLELAPDGRSMLK